MTHRARRPAADPFTELMTEVMATADRFGHREHVHLTWLAVRRHGMPDAIGLISDGIQQTARYAGAPQKYHATMSRAWVEVIAHHASTVNNEDFASFLARHPDLLSKRLLTRHYTTAALASPQARADWLQPDVAPFPWPDPLPPARAAGLI